MQGLQSNTGRAGDQLNYIDVRVDGLMKTCNLCDSKNKETSRFDLSRSHCCLDRVIELQPDFVAQRSRLEEDLSSLGHYPIFLPKFHCELNHIEMFWGSAKLFARSQCDYSLAGLRKLVPQALESVSLASIRRFARKSWRYIDLYTQGATGMFAEYANRKYKSHRAIDSASLALLKVEYYRKA